MTMELNRILWLITLLHAHVKILYEPVPTSFTPIVPAVHLSCLVYVRHTLCIVFLNTCFTMSAPSLAHATLSLKW